MKTIFIKFKQLILNPFVVSIGFTVLANLIQVFAFVAQGKLDDSNFALLNWGVYVFTLTNIPIEAFTKWLTIRLGKIEIEHRIAFLFRILSKSISSLSVLIIILSLSLFLFDNRSILIIFLCLISALTGLFSSFPRALLNVQSRFFEFNLLNLFMPIVRLFLTIFFVFNGSVAILFVGLIISSFLSFIASLFFIRKDLSFSPELLQKFNKISFSDNFNVSIIFQNVFLQIALSTFWLMDGLVLKKFLSDYDYSVYVSYSYIYKFPMFVAVGIAPVLLGKAVLSEENRTELKETVRKSIMIIFGLFGIFLLGELLFEGQLLGLLGYSRYFKQGFSLIFGLAWLVQTLVYFVFMYLLKIKANWKTYLAIFLYSLSFVIGLYVFRGSIVNLMWFVLGQGIVFVLVTLS